MGANPHRGESEGQVGEGREDGAERQKHRKPNRVEAEEYEVLGHGEQQG